jgi:HlyD family secretion protein
LIWAAAILACALSIGLLIRPRPVAVDVGIVGVRQLDVTIESEAKTRVHDRFIVSAPVAGRLSRTAYDEGDRVAVGQKIATIDPLPYNASIEAALQKLRELEAQRAGVETFRPKEEALAQARSRVFASRAGATAANARVFAAQASFEQADKEARRESALERQGFASQAANEQTQLIRTTRMRELQMAKTGAAAADAQVAIDQAYVDELTKKVRDPDYLRRVYEAQMAAIRAQLRTLEDQAHRTTVLAPVSGKVLRIVQKSEAYVSSGAPIIEIGSLRKLEIVADVLSQDAVRIRPGDAVEVVRGAGDDHPLAVVRLVEPSAYTKISALGIEEQRVNVVADLPRAPASLGDAYRLDVRIVTWSGKVLALPIPALVRCGADWCTFVVKNGTVSRRVLRIGQMGTDDVEIFSGVSSGERVVLRPTEAIKDGVRVSAKSP